MAKDGFVHTISNKMFTKEDEEEFNTKWTSQPCKRGDVRVTQSTLPHGSEGSATGVRRTILLWFVKVYNDYSSLETLEAGSWESLSLVYIQRFRNTTIRRAIRDFRDVKRAEKVYFGKKSYFYLGETHGFDNIFTVSDDEAPVNNNEKEEMNQNSENEGLDFVEQKGDRPTNISWSDGLT